MGTALQTFAKAQGRAKYLVRLAEGLVNTRKYVMRVDWARNFRKIMHWKIGTHIDRVDGRDAVVVLRDGATLSADDFNHSAISDLYRAALVMSVSAMDAYFHVKVLHYIVIQSKKSAPSKSLMNLKITVSDFVRGNSMKYRNSALRSAIERHLSFQSLQTPEKVATTLNLIGVKDFWQKVAKELKSDEDTLKKQIGKIVDRRNKIAHEGDVSQSKKTRNKDREVKPKLVRDALTLIDSVVAASEKVINAGVK